MLSYKQQAFSLINMQWVCDSTAAMVLYWATSPWPNYWQPHATAM